MIILENVTFRYNDEAEPVLRNISLEILSGESISVMGANGSGKSTFAKLIAGLINVKQGQLKIDNHKKKPIPVGIIFQNPDNQMVAVTVEKELAFALENLGYPQDKMEQLVTETLEKFNISHLRKRLTTELSGGEKQRVALSSVMIFQPDILILDEPDSFLDDEGKDALKKELNNIITQKPSMILIHITQYPEIAHQYNRLLVFHRGEIKADDQPEKIFDNFNFCLKTGLTFSEKDNKRIVIPSGNKRSIRESHQSLKTIILENVGFKYTDDNSVFKNISYTFNSGEIVGVAGLSGSGKSTLGSLICSLLKPGKGKVKYLSRDGKEIEANNLSGCVSGLFQQPERQFFLPTCLQEIAFGPKNLGQILEKKEIESLFAMVGLHADKLLDRDPFSLSGGEKRRLAFAAVLSMSPDFVVFDEPTCGLDMEGVGRFFLLAKALRDMGTGLVIISHDSNLLKRLADRIIYLRKDSSDITSSEQVINRKIP